MEVSSIRFERKSEYELIIIPMVIKIESVSMKVRMAIDTGASHTVLDANSFWVRGLEFSKTSKARSKGIGGIVEGFEINAQSMEMEGLKIANLPLFIYDFMAVGLAESYDGLLGLDFIGQTHFCIDFGKKLINLQVLTVE